MKSVYNFVVTPVGKRYNNTKEVEGGNLILNTEIYNHQFVNRIAKVISTPIIGVDITWAFLFTCWWL